MTAGNGIYTLGAPAEVSPGGVFYWIYPIQIMEGKENIGFLYRASRIRLHHVGRFPQLVFGSHHALWNRNL